MKKILSVLLTAAIVCGCAGCGNDSELTDYTEAQSSVNINVKKTEGGYFFTDFYNMPTVGVRYYDNETDIAISLCNKPECDHENMNCIAGSILESYAVFEDYIYYVCDVYTANETEIAIFRTACDGSSKTKVATICKFQAQNNYENITGVGNVFVHRGRLIFSYEGGNIKGVGEYDFKTGKIRTILDNIESEYTFSCGEFTGIGDNVYFRCYNDLMKYNMVTGEVQTLVKDLCSYVCSDGKNVYYRRLGSGKIFKINPDTDEETLVYEGDRITLLASFTAYDGYLITHKRENKEDMLEIIDENGVKYTNVNIATLVEEVGYKSEFGNGFKSGVDKNGDVLIHTLGIKDEARYNLIFGCSFDGLINGTEKPTLIFAAEMR